MYVQMTELEKVMSWLEGLSQDDWRQFHSDSEVSNIAKAALALLKEQEHKDNCPCTNCECYECIEVCDEYREWYQKEKA